MRSVAGRAKFERVCSGVGTSTDQVELRHGYTLDSLDRLACWAAQRKRWHRGLELSERTEVAWHAMAELLYASDEPPTVRDLIDTGWRAIAAQVYSNAPFHGYNRADPDGTTWRGFERFWWSTAGPTPGPEDRVVERLAVEQIWPRLRPSHRAALTALAAHGDYARAAESMDVTYHTFVTHVSRARREFLRLWHQGEAPSRPWVRDRRAGPGTDMHTVTYFLRSRRLRAQNRELAAAGR